MNDKYCLIRSAILPPPAKFDNCVVLSEKLINTFKRPHASNISKKPNTLFSIAVTKERHLRVLFFCPLSYVVGIKLRLVSNVPPAPEKARIDAFLYSIKE